MRAEQVNRGLQEEISQLPSCHSLGHYATIASTSDGNPKSSLKMQFQYASDLVAEMVPAMQYRNVAEDIAISMHSHATFSERSGDGCDWAFGASLARQRR